MTGPEHYREAEVLLADWAVHPDKIAAAQAHATLALAAATALGRESGERTMPARDRQAWFDAAGTPPSRDGEP